MNFTRAFVWLFSFHKAAREETEKRRRRAGAGERKEIWDERRDSRFFPGSLLFWVIYSSLVIGSRGCKKKRRHVARGVWCVQLKPELGFLTMRQGQKVCA